MFKKWKHFRINFDAVHCSKNGNIYYNNLNFRPNAGNTLVMKADSKTAVGINYANDELTNNEHAQYVKRRVEVEVMNEAV